MDKKSKNKVDAVIDEVLESKRLKQGAGIAVKTTLTLAVLLILGVALGIIR